MWRCGAQTTGTCNDNAEHFFEVLPCERFHRDATGPWAMLSDGMSYHSKCGANAVTFIKSINSVKNVYQRMNCRVNFCVMDFDCARK